MCPQRTIFAQKSAGPLFCTHSKMWIHLHPQGHSLRLLEAAVGPITQLSVRYWLIWITAEIRSSHFSASRCGRPHLVIHGQFHEQQIVDTVPSAFVCGEDAHSSNAATSRQHADVLYALATVFDASSTLPSPDFFEGLCLTSVGRVIGQGTAGKSTQAMPSIRLQDQITMSSLIDPPT